MNIFLISSLLLLLAARPSQARITKRVLQETQKLTATPTPTEVIPVTDISVNPDLVCNYEIMRSFGFSGHPTPKSTPHKYCPSISDNCCTAEDAEAAFITWNTDTRFKLERYYQIFNYAIKYLFGYTPEGFLLARKFSVEPTLECKRAANDYLSMNLNPRISMHIMSRINAALVNISNIRKGFYCSICDARVQSSFKDFFATTNLKTFTELYYSKEFCLTLVENTIESSFYMVSYVYRYLNNVVTLMNCQTGGVESPQIDLKSTVAEDVKNCFFFKNKYFFFFCQKYCNQFNLVKVSPVMDGDIYQLRKFVDFFVKYRKEAFEYPKNNLFADGVTYEENFLVDLYPEVLRDFVFFRASAQQSVFLDQYSTEVVVVGGMNPIPSTVSSKFELTLFGWAAVVRSVVAALVAINLVV